MRNRTRFRVGGKRLVATEQTAPTVSSATIPAAGTTVSVVYSEKVFIPPGAPGYSLNDGVLNYVLTVSSGNGTNTIVFAIGATISGGATCTLSRNSTTTAPTYDSFGNRLANFSGTSVTNNSTQP